MDDAVVVGALQRGADLDGGADDDFPVEAGGAAGEEVTNGAAIDELHHVKEVPFGIFATPEIADDVGVGELFEDPHFPPEACTDQRVTADRGVKPFYSHFLAGMAIGRFVDRPGRTDSQHLPELVVVEIEPGHIWPVASRVVKPAVTRPLAWDRKPDEARGCEGGDCRKDARRANQAPVMPSIRTRVYSGRCPIRFFQVLRRRKLLT